MTACRPTGGKTNYNSSLLQADAEGKRQPAGTLQPLGTVSYGLRLAGLVLQVPAGAGPKAGWRLPPERCHGPKAAQQTISLRPCNLHACCRRPAAGFAKEFTTRLPGCNVVTVCWDGHYPAECGADG